MIRPLRIFYALCDGVAWRMLPAGYPPWKTAFHYFRLWHLSGLWRHVAGMWIVAASLPTAEAWPHHQRSGAIRGQDVIV